MYHGKKRKKNTQEREREKEERTDDRKEQKKIQEKTKRWCLILISIGNKKDTMVTEINEDALRERTQLNTVPEAQNVFAIDGGLAKLPDNTAWPRTKTP